MAAPEIREIVTANSIARRHVQLVVRRAYLKLSILPIRRLMFSSFSVQRPARNKHFILGTISIVRPTVKVNLTHN